MSLKRFTCLSGIAAGALVAVIHLSGPSHSGNDTTFGVVPVASAATRAIQLSLTVSEERVVVRAPVMLHSTVTANGYPVAGATVSFSIARPNGTTTITVNTDKRGVAEWKYKAQHEGVYAITATASSAGLTAISDPVTFVATDAQRPATDVESRTPTGAIAQLLY